MYFRSQILRLAAAMFWIGGTFAQIPQDPSQYPQRQPGQPGPPGVPDATRTPSTLPQEQQIPTDPMASDKRFLKEAAEGGMIETELGKLAQERASSQAVKDFAKRVTEDHEKANEELKEVAAKTGLELPAEMPRKGKKAVEKLSKLSGAEFDREYTKMMLKDHKDDVKAFERQARSGKMPELRQFAARTLPALKEHLKMAEDLQAGTRKGS